MFRCIFCDCNNSRYIFHRCWASLAPFRSFSAAVSTSFACVARLVAPKWDLMSVSVLNAADLSYITDLPESVCPLWPLTHLLIRSLRPERISLMEVSADRTHLSLSVIHLYIILCSLSSVFCFYLLPISITHLFFFHFLSQRSGVLSSSVQKWWHMSSSQLPVSKSAFLYILSSLRRFLSAFSTQNTDTVVWFCVWVWYIKRGNHRDVFITVRLGEEVFKICCRIINPPDDFL